MTPQHMIEFWNDQEENDRIFACFVPVACKTQMKGIMNGTYTCEGIQITGLSYSVATPLETCKIKVLGEWVPWSVTDQVFLSERYRVDPNNITYSAEN